MDNDNTSKKQTHRSKEDRHDFIEQYKLYVQSADNNSERREASNRYHIGLNLAIIALYTVIVTNNYSFFIMAITGIFGISVSTNWWFTIRAFKNLSNIKFIIIQSMEEELPKQLYTEEEELDIKHKYKGVTSYQLLLSGLFFVIHAGITVLAFLAISIISLERLFTM